MSGATYRTEHDAPVHHGGQGTVWAARHVETGRRVALKVSHVGGAPVRALDSEQRVLASLAGRERASWHVTTMIDHGRAADGRPFLVLEWCEDNLEAWALDPARNLASRLFAAVLAGKAVDWLHTQGGTSFEMTIHHDIKLRNLLVDESGGALRVVLADFGTSRTGPADVEQTIPVEVTPGSAAPEAYVRGAKRLLDPSVDVFSLAAAVFLLLTGRRLSSASAPPAALFETAAYDLVRLYDLRELDSDRRARFEKARAEFDIEAALRDQSIHTYGDTDRDALVGAFVAFAKASGGDVDNAGAAATALWRWVAKCLAPHPRERPKSARYLLAALKRAGDMVGIDVEAMAGPRVGMLRTGDRVHQYVVEAKLGDGGMGEVYRVRHAALDTAHALKVLKIGGASLRDRLIEEGRVQARLRHPGIVRATDVVDVLGRPGLILELVDGEDLGARLHRGRLPPDDIDRVARAIMDAVSAAHRGGVVHRDLKPSNVLLATCDGVLQPKLMDFGLVKVVRDTPEGRTMPGALMGTPAYMAPEQARDPASVDARADVFSLGAILYELVTGRAAFGTDDVAAVRARSWQSRYLPVRALAPEAPDRQVMAIDAALCARPEDRPSSVEELRAVWDAERTWGVVDAQPAHSDTVAFEGPDTLDPLDPVSEVAAESPPPPPSPPARRNRWWWLAAPAVLGSFGVIVLASGFAAWMGLSRVWPSAAPATEPAVATTDARAQEASEPPRAVAQATRDTAAPPPDAPTPLQARPAPTAPAPTPPAPPPPTAEVPDIGKERALPPPLPARVKVDLSPNDGGEPKCSQDTVVLVDGVKSRAGWVDLAAVSGSFVVRRGGAASPDCDVAYRLEAGPDGWIAWVGGHRIGDGGFHCYRGAVRTGPCPR